MGADAISLILQGLNYVPQLIDVGRDVWNRVKPPSKRGETETKNGIVGKTFYSEEHKFQISIPDENWRFYEPTPQYIASLGTEYALPTVDVPIIILSKNMVRLYRPTVYITVEDVGTFTSIHELAQVHKGYWEDEGYSVGQENVKIQPNSNSAAIIATGGTFLKKKTLCAVEMIYLYAARAYYITAEYVPDDPDTPQMFGGLQDILNSFKLIK
jgi:hypothetical protein